MTLADRLRAGTTEPTDIEHVVRVAPCASIMLEAAERIAELEAALQPFAGITINAAIDGSRATVRLNIADVDQAEAVLKCNQQDERQG